MVPHFLRLIFSLRVHAASEQLQNATLIDATLKHLYFSIPQILPSSVSFRSISASHQGY
jgi:hypothetical protein